MKQKRETLHVGSADEESHPVRRETGQPINQAREGGKAASQAGSSGERAGDQPGRPKVSATSEKEGGKMEKLLQQILVALERQRADNASFRADVARQLADQRADIVDRDAARAKESADLRADFVDRDAARAKETADLRAKTARGFQHMTMWLAGVLLGIIAVLVAVVGVGIQLIDRLP